MYPVHHAVKQWLCGSNIQCATSQPVHELDDPYPTLNMNIYTQVYYILSRYNYYPNYILSSYYIQSGKI